MTAIYADPFLNALMQSHQITVKAQLYYNNAWVADLNVVGGTVSGDRSGSVRRTAQLTIDPDATKNSAAALRLKPYGSRVKIWRGIRYPSGIVAEEQVFYGRIDVVNTSLAGIELTCSDLAADVVDARFLDIMRPATLVPPQTTIMGCIKGLITDVHGATQEFDTTGITAAAGNVAVRSGTNWPQERGDALDSLCTQITVGSGATAVVGAEWYFDMVGKAHVHPLPAVLTSGTVPDWIIDSGDTGVLVDRVNTLDRQGVYNGVRVEGEAVGGETPASQPWKDERAGSDTLWGGPFGKVVNYYTGQQLDPNTTDAAKKLAEQLGMNSIASVRSLAVTCVPNPKLQLGRPVRVFTGSTDIDGMYFVQNLVLPLDPESPMTMTLYTAYELAADDPGGYRLATPRLPKGATWQPTR